MSDRGYRTLRSHHLFLILAGLAAAKASAKLAEASFSFPHDAKAHPGSQAGPSLEPQALDSAARLRHGYADISAGAALPYCELTLLCRSSGPVSTSRTDEMVLKLF